MPRYIASFELADATREAAFTNHALRFGWEHAITSRANIWHRLPRGTLCGSFDNIDAALQAFDAISPAFAVALKAPVIIDKLIIVEYSVSKLRSNEKRTVK